MLLFGERDVCVFSVRKVKFLNMFHHSFSISIIFPQVQWCQQACILNRKCSRRNQKSKKHATLSPKMMKTEKNCKLRKISKRTEIINVSFSVSNSIDFWPLKIDMTEKRWSKCEKLSFWKTAKNDKNEFI